MYDCITSKMSSLEGVKFTPLNNEYLGRYPLNFDFYQLLGLLLELATDVPTFWVRYVRSVSFMITVLSISLLQTFRSVSLTSKSFHFRECH